MLGWKKYAFFAFLLVCAFVSGVGVCAFESGRKLSELKTEANNLRGKLRESTASLNKAIETGADLDARLIDAHKQLAIARTRATEARAEAAKLRNRIAELESDARRFTEQAKGIGDTAGDIANIIDDSIGIVRELQTESGNDDKSK